MPSARDTQKWWSSDNGHTIINRLYSQDPIPRSASKNTSLLGGVTLSTPKYPKKHSKHCPCDRFMDPSNSILLAVDFATELRTSPTAQFQGLTIDDLIDQYKSIFPADIRNARFHDALEGLDLLWEFECIRRKIMQVVPKRLGIMKSNFREVLHTRRDLRDDINTLEQMEELIDDYFIATYIGLRIWVFSVCSLNSNFANYTTDNGRRSAVGAISQIERNSNVKYTLPTYFQNIPKWSDIA